MAANINDKFSEVSTGVRPTTTTVASVRATSGTSLVCDDLTGWTTDTAVHFVTYQVDGQGQVVPGTQTDIKGTVNGNTITNLVITGGTDNGNAVGDIVQQLPTAAWAKDLADGLQVSHNLDGTIKDEVIGGSWKNWTPTFGTSGSMTYSSVTVAQSEYTIVGKTVFYRIRASGTTGGTASTDITFTAPVSKVSNDVQVAGSAYVVDPGLVSGWVYFSDANVVRVRKYDNSNWGLGASRQINVQGFYEVA